MGSLIFSCPKTWRVIESGIDMDDATFARLQSCSLSLACPYCDVRHALTIKDGHLFKMRPRKAQIHFTGLLCDEVDVGVLVQRTLARDNATVTDSVAALEPPARITAAPPRTGWRSRQ